MPLQGQNILDFSKRNHGFLKMSFCGFHTVLFLSYKPSFHCVPCLIGAGRAVPTDRRAAVSTNLDFPIYATCVSSVCGSLAAIQPLFTVVANVIILAVFVLLFVFLAFLAVVRASVAILVIFETLPI